MTALTINLGGPSYEKIRYPAGELQVRLTDPNYVKRAAEITVIARIQSSEAVMETLLLLDAIDRGVDLIIPYMPYSRADRRFCEGDCFGSKVFRAVLDSTDYHHRIFTLDLHSDKPNPSPIRVTNVSPMPLIEKAIVAFAGDANLVNVLLPDAGAMERYELKDKRGNNHRLITVKTDHASKVRDPLTGRLVSFTVPRIPDAPTLIVDDICDGGGTFLGIRKLLPENMRVGLYVTHGIFSKGLSELSAAFSHIYTTDSFIPDLDAVPSNVTQFDCLPVIKAAVKR